MNIAAGAFHAAAVLVSVALIGHSAYVRGRRATIGFLVVVAGLSYLRDLVFAWKGEGGNAYQFPLPFQLLGVPPIAVLGWIITTYLSWCIAETILSGRPTDSKRVFAMLALTYPIGAAISLAVEPTGVAIGLWRWRHFDPTAVDGVNDLFTTYLPIACCWGLFVVQLLGVFWILDGSPHRRSWRRLGAFLFLVVPWSLTPLWRSLKLADAPWMFHSNLFIPFVLIALAIFVRTPFDWPVVPRVNRLGTVLPIVVGLAMVFVLLAIDLGLSGRIDLAATKLPLLGLLGASAWAANRAARRREVDPVHVMSWSLLTRTRRIWAVVAIVVAAGLLVRVSRITYPLTNERGAHSSMIARNIAADGVGGLLHPRVDYPADATGVIAQEFPLVAGLGALALTILPSDGDAPLKIPSLAFFVVGALFLFDLVRRRLGDWPALFAVALFALYPLHVVTSASPQPDEGALALTTGAIALLDRSLESADRRWAIGAVVCAALGFLAKPSFLFVAVPLAGLMVGARGARSLRSSRFLLGAVLAVSPLVCWLAYAHFLNTASELCPGMTASDLNREYLEQKGRLAFYESGSWYLRIGQQLVSSFTLPGALLGIMGLLVGLAAPHHRALIVSWILGFVLYCIAVPNEVYLHAYYSLPMAPLAAFLGALAGAEIARRVRVRVLSWAIPGAVLVLVGLIAVPQALKSLRTVDKAKVAFGGAARRIVPEGSRLIVSANMIGLFNGSVPYQTRRRCWKYSARILNDEDPEDLRELEMARRLRGKLATPAVIPYAASARCALTVDALEELRSRGAAFFGYFGPPVRWIAEQRDLARHLFSRYAAAEVAPQWIFFDLRRAMRDASFVSSKPGLPTKANGFELVSMITDPLGSPASPRRLLVWRVTTSAPPDALNAFGGLVPADIFEPGTLLYQRL